MELKTGYSAYDHDQLDPADSMRIERKLYFEQEKADISTLTALPLEQVQAYRPGRRDSLRAPWPR